MHGPNVRRINYFNQLGRGKVFLGEQADGSWVARTEGNLLRQTSLVPGSNPEEAAGAMIVQLEEAGHDVPEPPDEFMEDRGLGR